MEKRQDRGPLELIPAEDLILPNIHADNKNEVIRELGEWLAQHHQGLSQEEVISALADREQLGSTALGDGVAIPHAKLESAGNLVACLGRSRKGIEFGSPDSRPTHLFFVLVAPASSPGGHLKALARISRLFKDAGFRARLMAAETAHDMYEILAEEDAK